MIKNGGGTESNASQELKSIETLQLDVENQSLPEKGERRRCCDLYPYGKKKTLTTTAVSIVALIASVMAKRSTSFITLNKSLAPHDIIYLPTYNLGLYRIELCTGSAYNTSAVYGEKSISLLSEYNHTSNDGTYRRDMQGTSDIFFQNSSRCEIVRLEAAEVGDKMWDFARLAGAVAVLCGILMTFWLIFSCCSSKVNIRALAVLGLFTYLFESLTFTFFCSKVCDELGCSLSSGGFYSIIASLCWFSASFGTVHMYNNQKSILLDMGYQMHFSEPIEPKIHI